MFDLRKKTPVIASAAKQSHPDGVAEQAIASLRSQ